MVRPLLIVLGIGAVIAAIGAIFLATAAPLITSEQAVSMARAMRDDPTDHVQSTVLTLDGSRPPQARDMESPETNCWGARSPAGDVCLPYPVWKVYLAGQSGSDCSRFVYWVDARKSKVVAFYGVSGPCGDLDPLP